ncbi:MULTISPECIES: dihydrodipicolinate synthase family protein [Thermus]|jgi:4-hydroxy-2-oxoglutarate aldolase|uniref:Dihidrodipicolinate synthase n=1 Tax=Thermus thermophilus (strain ATCC 27634 / DSM 579 / HB8) TaxID=300852 RepID=Q5SKB1_THET8|nr:MULTISPECIES: dihydrodipicolinate synthase family protein [Thermus]QZY59230.1 dihydrodipicolinate synthase family protein [Thermus thermophilus]BAD70560.1 putative dihidrodipicolinate synthase [Thermus thermophilus HB8]BDA37373.1 dihydrodipicolinate synthase family protein [Thermus thermophilus]BDE45098.1 dihydrodipicolinate synthase family protein [Thermus thermophilus]HAH39835.1 dihydrodipicolinate synthase family protein [Thermus sp.]
MILPPIPTPFDREGRLDEEAFRELAQALEPLVDGLLVYGSNGEGVHLTPEERARGLRALRPRKPFLVGLMEETLPQAEGALLEAKAAGAMALLATPPRYYHGSLGAGLLRYYEALAEKMPLFLYHVPQNTKVDLPLEAVEALAPHPNVLGIKDSSGDLSRIAFYQARLQEFRVYTGHAPTFLGALALGAEGGILAAANLAPRAYRALLDHFREGRLAEAQELQKKLFPLGDLLAKGGVPLLKQALRHLGLPAGYPRPPYPAESPLWERFLPVLEGLKEEGWVL